MSNFTNEIDRNYEAFERQLPTLLRTHPGKFALMHDEQIVTFFDNAKAAVSQGLRQFGLGKYSVKEVTSQADDLGFYSYAGGSLQA